MDDEEERETQMPEIEPQRDQGSPFMPGTLRIARIFGIEVGIHYTWLIAFALITWSLAIGFFPVVLPNQAAWVYWATGAAATILLFVSVLIHEFSHSIVAQTRGLPVQSITLFVFGGVSSITEESHDPLQEFLVAIVGPVSSFILAGIFWLGYLATGPGPSPTGAVLFYLAIVNLLLAVFNLIPGFPLDGGRVLRAIIWAITGNLRRSTNLAASVGQVFAFLFIAFGIFEIFVGNLIGGIWIAFIGWFLNSAAENSRRQSTMSEAFRGVRVRDLMAPDPPVVRPSATIRDFIDEYALRRGARALLISTDGRLGGIVTLADVHKMPTETWGETTVGEIMTPSPLVTVGPEVELPVALRLMGERDLNQLPVIENGALVGLLSRSNVIRYLQYQEELGFVLPQRPSAGAPPEEGEDEHRRAA